MSPSGASASPSAPSIDTLFETRGVDELSTYSRTLQRSIDMKREELRVMVGERYRDLMEAAETIQRMKGGSEKVIVITEEMIAKQKQLQAKAVIGFSSTTSNSLMDSSNPNAPYLAIAAQIKVLMAAPEKIWSSVENGDDYLTASQMYLFARHVHTCLTLEPPLQEQELGEGGAVNHLAWFPVVGRQWAAIAHFYDAILQGCQKTLESSADPSIAIQAMATILLLKGLSSQEIFEEYLNIRRATLERQLAEDKQKSTAKTMIHNSLKILMTTVDVIHKAFQGADLASVLSGVSCPTLSLFETKISPVLKHLPPIVRDFSPTLMKPMETLDSKFIQTELTRWLDGIHDLIQEDTKVILGHVNNITALSSMRKSIYDLLAGQKKLTPNVWDEICQSVLGRDLNLWDEFYRGLFRDRTESLVSSQVAGSVYCVQSNLAALVADFQSELNMSDYLWSESSLSEVNFFPKHGASTASSAQASSKKASSPSSLELKSKGFSPKVQNLCQQFDSMLKKMLDDLSFYVRSEEDEDDNVLLGKLAAANDPFSFMTEPESKVKEPFLLNSDSEAILKFIQENIVEQFNGMIDHIDKSHSAASESVQQGDRAYQSGCMIFLGRFFQAIPELCPYLEKCITAPQTFAKKTEVTTLEQMQQRRAAAGKVDPKWTQIRSKLESESIRMFKIWIKLLNEDLNEYLTRSLAEDDAILVQIIPAWDSIEISEEAEEGVEVKSKILVPQHPSMAWFCALSEYCQKVYSIAPYSLPTVIQLAISQESAETVVKVYESVSRREKLAQRIALQLHFDIQLVQQSLITRENRDLNAMAQSVISELENHIDPFDLSVFSPYMALHVKKTILRESGLLSVLIPQDRFTLLASIKSSLATSNPVGASSEQHNTMWMLDHKPDKIPLIPIPRSALKKKQEEKERMSRMSVQSLHPNAGGGGVTASLKSPSASSLSGARRKRDKSPMTKATGSFFEAMSTSWFGGSAK